MAVWLCFFWSFSYGAAGQAWDDVDVSETPAPYREIIQKANSMILNGVDDGGSVEDGYYALSELGFYLNQAELLDQVGYAVQDLSGDGVPELIIGDRRNHPSGYAGLGFQSDLRAVHARRG